MCTPLFKVIFSYFFLNLNGLSATPNEPIVQIEFGKNTTLIEGTRQIDWMGGVYFAFRGIPYAKSPTGDLRFKDPKPLDYLPHYIDARYDGHECLSIPSTNGSEDCLTLNVYTRNLRPTKPLPVIVFIHFGGLYLGSSSSSLIGAQYMLVKDVVLVTFNYRLGSLGFLNLGTEDVPGNAGFKDQVHAMRWVKKYIQHFGGHNDDITLMGYSAGGLSVSLHLASPMSRGLFHKAIVMSGAVPPQTKLPRGEQIKLAIRQCRKLNCQIEDSATPEQILNCLNGFSGAETSRTLRSMFVFGKDHPLYLWRPVVERDFGQERFLIEDFYESISRGRFERVPLLIGFTNGEFCTSAAEILNNNQLKGEFEEEFQTLGPHILMLEEQVNASQLTRAIREYYNKNNNWQFDQICNMISDALIRFGAHKLGSLAAQFGNVYGYVFAYRGAYSALEYHADQAIFHLARAEHMDDLMYLFQMPIHHFERQEVDAKIVELFVDFIWDFVTNGKISGSQTFLHGHTLIKDELMLQNGSIFSEAAFWQQLFP